MGAMARSAQVATRSSRKRLRKPARLPRTGAFLHVLACTLATTVLAAQGPLEPIRAVAAEGNYSAAQDDARRLLASVEAESGAESLAAAQMIDTPDYERVRRVFQNGPETPAPR